MFEVRELPFGTEPGGHLVTAKLTSIHHKAKRNDAVSRRFNFIVNVSDGGRNNSGSLMLNDQTIPPGSNLFFNEQIFIGEYDSLSVGEIKFTFIVMGGGEVEVFEGITKGDNSLKPGVQFFVAPVVLELNSGERSELIFKGRVDLA